MSQTVRERLVAAGVRPTSQRLALAELLLDGPHRHVTARELFLEAAAAGGSVSMGTVYNTLSELVRAGLLTEVFVDGAHTWYDTNTTPHCHVVDVEAGTLRDVHVDLDPASLPVGPDEEIVDLQIVIRVRRRPGS